MRKRKYNNNPANRPVGRRFVSNVQVVKGTRGDEETPVAVSVLMLVRGLDRTMVVMQFDDPAHVETFIAELGRLRREVWPEDELVVEDGWVSVGERLPEDKWEGRSNGVLIAIEIEASPASYDVRLGHYDYNQKVWWDAWGAVGDGPVTRWHPIPPIQEEHSNEPA